MMIGFASVVLMFAACAGSGALIFAGLGLLDDFSRTERIVWSFAAGLGVIGWLVFFLAYVGWLEGPILAAPLVVCAAGGFLLLKPAAPAATPSLDSLGQVLVGAVFVALVFDLLEGVSPPADADTLAYHFALPKQFLAAGRLEFVPRAADGAVPLIVQMTYLPVLALGGEQALTLWTMLSGWMAVALLFVLSRHHLGLNWSLTVALVFLTTPAVIYGGGSGQVEVRLALFAMVAAFAVAKALHTGKIGYAVLAGVAAGFYAGGKYIGLLVVAACGMSIVVQSRWLAHGAAFGIAALVAGSQWYAWNWINTGDPVFPLLFEWLRYEDTGVWDQAHHEIFKTIFFGSELPLRQTPFWFLAYPFMATLDPHPAFESRRTGLGPYVLLILPFTVAGLWRYRQQLRRTRLAPVAAITLIFYALWFFSGSSQRIRHLVPFYPLLLICTSVAAARWAETTSRVRPLAVAAAATIVLQIGGHALFSVNYFRHLTTGESREAFYGRNVPQFVAAAWINENLTAKDRVLHVQRQISYLLDVPYFRAPQAYQAVVDLGTAAENPKGFWRQLLAQNITHVLMARAPEVAPGRGWPPVEVLLDHGCARLVRSFRYNYIASRTLPALSKRVLWSDLLELNKASCRL